MGVWVYVCEAQVHNGLGMGMCVVECDVYGVCTYTRTCVHVCAFVNVRAELERHDQSDHSPTA